MTSKIVVNNIQTDAGISSVTLLSHVAGHDSTQNISGINSVTATSFHGSGANLTSIPAANITGTLPAISGANLTNLNGSNISSGIVTSARLGGGTASNTTFLRGDGTFQTVTSTSATATPRIDANNTVAGQRIASDLTYSSGDQNANHQLGNVSYCNASTVYALEVSLTYQHNGAANHGYLTGYIYQRGKTYSLVGGYVFEQHYNWYYNYTMNRFIIPWDPSGTQALDIYISNAYNTSSSNKFFVDITNKLENI